MDAVSKNDSSRPAKAFDFLYTIYVLRKSARQSYKPSTAEISRLENETRLPEWLISSWFDGERQQREFWISQTSLPTPQTTELFSFGGFDQRLASSTGSNTLVSHVPITPYPTTHVRPDSPTHVNSETQIFQAVSTLQPQHRVLNTSTKTCSIDQTPQRKRQRSDSNDNADKIDEFSCLTCPKSSTCEEGWLSHQTRCHFPRTIWICGGADGKPCNVPPCYRGDNFRKHLVTFHGFAAGSAELKAEKKKRAIKVTGLFHEKCGFCKKDLDSWGSSMQHIWEHVGRGETISGWMHACKDEEHTLQAGVHYMQPPEISQPDGDDVDKDKDNGDDPDDDPNFGGSHGANHGFEFFDDLDNFDFGPSFDGDGSGHNFSYDASGSYHYQTSFPDLDLGRAATSLGQALASERQSLLQQFSFVRTLGSGGFGRVDEVTCNELRQRFALKILRRPIPGIKSSSQVAAFRNEVEILKTLKHPHIIRFAGSRVYGNAFSILMYPVVKENLATYLAQLDGKLHRSLSANSTSQTALNVLWTLMGCFASALSNIHSVNIIHGDLKPENILIDGAQIFLSDFGSAKKLSNDSNPLEAMCILSPEFAAPEAIKYGQKDTAGDIWSFGCILTLVVTCCMRRSLDGFKKFRSSDDGQTSFHSASQKTLEWLQMLEDQVQVPPTAKFEKTIFKLIRQMISEEPSARPTAEDVWSLLPQKCQCNSLSTILTPHAVVAKEALAVNHFEGPCNNFDQIKACLGDSDMDGQTKRDRLAAIASNLEVGNKPWVGHVLALLCESLDTRVINDIMTHGPGIYKKQWDKWHLGERPEWQSRNGEETIRDLVYDLLMNDLTKFYTGYEARGARVEALSIKGVCEKVRHEIGIVVIREFYLDKQLKIRGVKRNLQISRKVQTQSAISSQYEVHHSKLTPLERLESKMFVSDRSDYQEINRHNHSDGKLSPIE